MSKLLSGLWHLADFSSAGSLQQSVGLKTFTPDWKTWSRQHPGRCIILAVRQGPRRKQIEPVEANSELFDRVSRSFPASSHNSKNGVRLSIQHYGNGRNHQNVRTILETRILALKLDSDLWFKHTGRCRKSQDVSVHFPLNPEGLAPLGLPFLLGFLPSVWVGVLKVEEADCALCPG